MKNIKEILFVIIAMFCYVVDFIWDFATSRNKKEWEK